MTLIPSILTNLIGQLDLPDLEVVTSTVVTSTAAPPPPPPPPAAPKPKEEGPSVWSKPSAELEFGNIAGHGEGAFSGWIGTIRLQPLHFGKGFLQGNAVALIGIPGLVLGATGQTPGGQEFHASVDPALSLGLEGNVIMNLPDLAQLSLGGRIFGQGLNAPVGSANYTSNTNKGCREGATRGECESPAPTTGEGGLNGFYNPKTQSAYNPDGGLILGLGLPLRLTIPIPECQWQVAEGINLGIAATGALTVGYAWFFPDGGPWVEFFYHSFTGGVNLNLSL